MLTKDLSFKSILRYLISRRGNHRLISRRSLMLKTQTERYWCGYTYIKRIGLHVFLISVTTFCQFMTDQLQRMYWYQTLPEVIVAANWETWQQHRQIAVCYWISNLIPVIQGEDSFFELTLVRASLHRIWIYVANSIFRSKQVFNNPAKNISLNSYASYSATLLRSIDCNFKWCDTFLSVSGTWNLQQTWFFKWKAFLQKRQW